MQDPEGGGRWRGRGNGGAGVTAVLAGAGPAVVGQGAGAGDAGGVERRHQVTVAVHKGLVRDVEVDLQRPRETAALRQKLPTSSPAKLVAVILSYQIAQAFSLQRHFTSTETTRLIGDQESRTATTTFPQLLSYKAHACFILCYIQ